MSEEPANHDDYGVLVGWEHRIAGERLDLKLQTVQSSRQLAGSALDNRHIIMTRNQALLLANYLLEVSGKSPPAPRRGRLTRWFGG